MIPAIGETVADFRPKRPRLSSCQYPTQYVSEKIAYNQTVRCLSNRTYDQWTKEGNVSKVGSTQCQWHLISIHKHRHNVHIQTWNTKIEPTHTTTHTHRHTQAYKTKQFTIQTMENRHTHTNTHIHRHSHTHPLGKHLQTSVLIFRHQITPKNDR